MRTIAPLLLLAACAVESPDERELLSFDDAETLDALGWTHEADRPMPPPIGSLRRERAAMVGAPLDLLVSSLPAGVNVRLAASLQGPGVGPCHPGTGACVDILAPRLLGSAVTDASGRATFSVDPPSAGWAAFQVVVLGPAGVGTTSVLEVEVADVQATWAYDQLYVEVDHGESAYFFGMAETFAGPVGWYGEDCLPFTVCHTVSGSLLLTSVHPDVGGPGLGSVSASSTTLFYDIHGPYVTYYLEGLDSGDCWTWGDDPSYYPSCTPLY